MKKKLKKQQQQQNAEEEEEEEEHEHEEDDTHVIPNTAPLTTRGVHQCYCSSTFLPLLLLLYMLLFFLSLSACFSKHSLPFAVNTYSWSFNPASQ